MKTKLKKFILKMLVETNALEFKTWKSQTHLEQYTAISFFGKEIKRIKWSGIELMNVLK